MRGADFTETPQPPPKSFCGPSAAPPRTLWEMFTRAWRPSGGWVCILILLIRGAVLPLLQHYAGRPVDGFDFTAAAALLGALGFGVIRSYDRQMGVA